MMEFNDTEVVQELVIEVKVKLTASDIDNLIVTAFEGGTDHWAGIIYKKELFSLKPKGVAMSQWITKLLLEGQEVMLCDIEDRSERWVLTLQKLLNGITLSAKERPEHIDMDNWDAEDAGCIIQYALFGRVEYS